MLCDAGKPPFGPDVSPQSLLIFDGYMDADVYRNGFKYIAQTYFTQVA